MSEPRLDASHDWQPCDYSGRTGAPPMTQGVARTIYLVVEASGEYDDYRTTNVMAFSTKQLADVCVAECNRYRDALPPCPDSLNDRTWTRQDNRRRRYRSAQPFGANVDDDSSYTVAEIAFLEDEPRP